MELHELIWKRLSEDGQIGGQLAEYAGQPAVFTPEAPSDNAEGWNGMDSYPRIVFAVDMSVNEERKCQGTVLLSADARNDGGFDFGSVAEAVRRSLCNVILTPSGDSYCLVWNRSDGYVIQGSNIRRQELQLDILEYPPQETADPDPIDGINAWLKALYPEALVMWHDRMEQQEEITPERPVLYSRLETDSVVPSPSTHAVVWMDASIAVHIICSEGRIRRKYACAIGRSLALEEEYELLDRSPFLVSSITVTPSADYLRTGQVRINGRYGILRQTEKKRRLQEVGKEYRKGG